MKTEKMSALIRISIVFGILAGLVAISCLYDGYIRQGIAAGIFTIIIFASLFFDNRILKPVHFHHALEFIGEEDGLLIYKQIGDATFKQMFRCISINFDKLCMFNASSNYIEGIVPYSKATKDIISQHEKFWGKYWNANFLYKVDGQFWIGSIMENGSNSPLEMRDYASINFKHCFKYDPSSLPQYLVVPA